jgi:hypothetical protein
MEEPKKTADRAMICVQRVANLSRIQPSQIALPNMMVEDSDLLA